MNNELYRKLTSITLMTIMFAGGMTIAIPGETPTAVAQTNTLSVSASAAGVFGGAQVIEIVIDDPDVDEVTTPRTEGIPDVEVDGEILTMAQAPTGKWYAYVAAQAFADSDLTTDDAAGGYEPVSGFLSGSPIESPVVWVFPFDGEVEITANRGDEVVTLDYDDHSDIATINVDRNDAPVGGQVHITISDFQLNLDPTTDDAWTLNATDSTATYDITVGDTVTPYTIDFDEVSTSGDLTITMSRADVIEYKDAEGNDGTPSIVAIGETGSNTGVFESQDGDNSEIRVSSKASAGDTSTIGYADDEQQVIVNDFSSTLELIADGTWDSGEALTIRLSSENLDLNTLDDEDMTTAESDDLPVLILGDPIKLTEDLTSLTTYDNDDIDPDNDEVPRGTITVGNAYVGALNIPDTEATADNAVNFTIPLSGDDVRQINSGDSYVHYMGPDVTVTGINGTETIDIDDSVDAPSLTAVVAISDSITLNYTAPTTGDVPIIFDIFTFGDGVNHAIYRALLEETGDGTAVFEGTVEYQILNQRTVDDIDTHTGITTIDDELAIILNEGLTGTDAPTVVYDDTHVRENAPSHTGEVSFDAATYNVADEVTVILVDPDLNIDADGIDIYTVDATVGDKTELLSLEIGGCDEVDGFGTLSMRETTGDSGTFEGTFDVPARCPADSTDDDDSTTGEDISATYYDFRDSSGSENSWSDSATIGADTGSVSFDRTVYPVPAAADDDKGIRASQVTVYVSIEDADFDESSDSINSIMMDEAPVTVSIDGIDVATFGGPGDPIDETSADSGIFEGNMKIGPSMDGIVEDDEGKTETATVEQGSIITVTYKDPTDASGTKNSVSDSATFDLRNAVLQSDKSTYVIGQDALLTLIEPDLNLDSASQETVPITRIEWDSDADTVNLDETEFGAVPTNLRETDLNTGIFQVVITIPKDINETNLERGEDITLTYTDHGPSGADSVGDDDRDVELSIKTSNFGATLELDQNVYTWTDKVFITVVASDYNFDSNVIDEIGDAGDGEITIRVRSEDIEQYNLAETGPDTGVFTGEVRLIGTTFDSDDGNIELTVRSEQSTGSGPTDGTIEADNGDGLSVSFEYSDSESPLVASALIRWNVGEVQWLEASYAATGSGIVRVIDPDMNLNPDAVDNLDMVAYSETFLGGITLTVTETQEASGIFEGTVEFDPDEASQGHRLQVTEGDIVTAEYDDTTLPDDDDLTISATTLIGSIVPPLERAPASNPAIVDAFDNALASVSVDQQVQITADLTSGQDRDQDFAYLVQIQNEDGVTIALSWITGTLGAGATFSPSQSWTPSETGSYTATIFVWESVSNPTALSPQLSITIDVV